MLEKITGKVAEAIYKITKIPREHTVVDF